MMPDSLTHKELRRQLMYNPWTGVFYWKIRSANRIHIGDIAGCFKDDYISIRINNILYPAHRLAWFYVYGYMPENDIDHIDRIKHHNWIKNLREVSKICNARNTGNRKNNKSGVKGVSWNKNTGKWRSEIMINKKSKHLGVNEDFDEAVCIRLAAEQCVDWEGCDSNSPAYLYVKENIQGI